MTARGKYPSETADAYSMRFPEGMRDRLKAAAADNNRSMNAEIIYRLDRSFESGAMALDSEIAALLARYVDGMVSQRLRLIASQINSASAAQ